jgi:hypothetical protein
MGTIWWCFDKARRQEQLDVALLTEQSLEEALAECEEWMRELDSGVKEPTTLRQFNNQAAMDFDDWDTDMVTRLRQKKGAQRTGMGYIARRSPEPGFDPVANAQSEIEKLEYQLPLHGPKFQADNTKVFAMVQAATTGTIAAPWIEDYAPLQDGRESIKALRSHYEGVDMNTRRETAAQRTLDNAIYTSERIMTFETFVTTLMKAFTLHAKQGQEFTDAYKVRELHKKIQVPNNIQVQSAKEFMMGRYSNDFQGACTFMSTRIAQIFPSVPTAKSGTRQISGVNINGVEISDINNIPDEIWNTLGQAGKKKVFDMRNKATRGGRGRGRGRGRGSPHHAGRSNGNRYRSYNNYRGGGYRGGRGGRGRGRGGYGRGRGNQWNNDQWDNYQGGDNRQINAANQQQQSQQPLPQQQGSSNANAQQGQAQGQGQTNQNNGGGNRGSQNGARFGQGRGAYRY